MYDMCSFIKNFKLHLVWPSDTINTPGIRNIYRVYQLGEGEFIGRGVAVSEYCTSVAA